MAKENELVIPEITKREVRPVHDDTMLANLLDTAKFEHMQRLAKVMAAASILPQHLRGQTIEQTIGNCFRIANQAVRWGIDPFATCDETYVVKGRLGYQGKLVAAVVNTRAGLQKRLSYSHTGAGMDRTVTVSGTFEGEAEPRTITLSVKQGKTDNEMWTKDPDQKLCYSGAVKWARRHCPEILLGVFTDDEIDRMREADESGDDDERVRTLDDLASRLTEVRRDEALKPLKSEPEESEVGETVNDSEQITLQCKCGSEAVYFEPATGEVTCQKCGASWHVPELQTVKPKPAEPTEDIIHTEIRRTFAGIKTKKERDAAYDYYCGPKSTLPNDEYRRFAKECAEMWQPPASQKQQELVYEAK